MSPGGHCWNYYTDNLPCSQFPAAIIHKIIWHNIISSLIPLKANQKSLSSSITYILISNSFVKIQIFLFMQGNPSILRYWLIPLSFGLILLVPWILRGMIYIGKEMIILFPSYLHSEKSQTDKMWPIYWLRSLVEIFMDCQTGLEYCTSQIQSSAVITQFNISWFHIEQCKDRSRITQSNVCTHVANCLCTHERVILVFISRVAQQRGK